MSKNDPIIMLDRIYNALGGILKCLEDAPPKNESEINFIATLKNILHYIYEGNYTTDLEDGDINAHYEIVNEFVRKLSKRIPWELKFSMDGSNPLKYADLTGMKIDYGVDYNDLDSHYIILCDLNNPSDMQKALSAWWDMGGMGREAIAIASDSATGMSIEFHNPDAMRDLINTDIDWEGLLGAISTTVGLATIGSSIDDLRPALTKTFAKFGTRLTWVAVGIDVKQAWDNPNADTISDLIISGIGLVKLPGTAISIGLAYTKKAIVGVATGAAKLNEDLKDHFFEKAIDQMWENFYYSQ